MLNVASTAILTILLFLSTSAKAEGPQIQLVPDQNALATILSVLDTAQTSIDLLQFSFAIDDPGSGEINTALDSYQVAEKLVELKQAKRESLRIRLYLEGQRSTSKRNRKTAEYLEAHGIEVHWGGTHAKAIIVDGKTVFFGSTNLTHQSLRGNNETNMVIWDHPEFVRYFLDYFNLLWEAHPRSPGIYSAAAYKEGIRLYTDGAYKALLLDLIQTASATLDFSIYYFNEPEIEAALIDAHTRGVKIRGYMNHGEGIDAQLSARNLATAARLRSEGIAEIYFDQDSFFSHSKYLIADGKTIALGTGNWNRSDIEEHPQLYVEIRNADLAKKLAAHLSSQIAYESNRTQSPQLLHRFWLGWRHTTLSQPDFDSAIDNRFVGATVETGKNRGLHSYQPVLPVSGGQEFRGSGGRHFAIPDEVALVTYRDPETYRAIRDTPPGTAYAQLHRDYFLMESGHALNSHSVVPAPYAGTVAIGKAYDLSAPNVDWQKGTGYFALTLRKVNASDDSYIQGLQTYLRGISDHQVEFGMRGYVVLIHPHYIIEYFNLVESARYERSITKIRNEKDNSQVLRVVSLHEQKIAFQPQGQTRIVRNQTLGAISVLFDRELDKQRIARDSLAEFKQSFKCQAE